MITKKDFFYSGLIITASCAFGAIMSAYHRYPVLFIINTAGMFLVGHTCTWLLAERAYKGKW